MGQVVDVFTGTGEVHKFQYGFQFFIARELVFQKVLHGFYVVVGGAFDIFDALGIHFVEVVNNRVQLRDGGGAESGHFGNTGVAAELLQPTYLDFDTAADQAKFTENAAQGDGLAAVASVDWRYGVEG